MQLIFLVFFFYLVFIVITAIAFPYICAAIIRSNKFKVPTTVILLSITIALYLLACTIGESALDNWCYSLYIGIVLTPGTLFTYSGLRNPKRWPENNESIEHDTITIPVLTFVVSLLFAIEGLLRMFNLTSAYTLLNKLINTNSIHLLHSLNEFHYAGALLFFVSVITALIIFVYATDSYQSKKRKMQIEEEKRLQKEQEINKTSQSFNEDLDALYSLPSDSNIKNETIRNYELFCNAFATAIMASDERSVLSYKYNVLNEMNSTFKSFVVTERNIDYHFYPVGIIVRYPYGHYKYVPYDRNSLFFKTEERKKREAISGNIKPVRQYWLHACRDGSQDLRYRNNPQIYVYEYVIVFVERIRINIFQKDVADAFEIAYKKLYSNLLRLGNETACIRKEPNQIEVKSFSVKPIDKNETREKVKRDLENTRFGISVNDAIQTLEGCFCDLIRKRGLKILKDASLANIISSQYKGCDIKDLKDILVKMASEEYFYQFVEPSKQNDFALYNISNTFAHRNKLNAQKCLYITQIVVLSIKQQNENKNHLSPS